MPADPQLPVEPTLPGEAAVLASSAAVASEGAASAPLGADAMPSPAAADNVLGDVEAAPALAEPSPMPANSNAAVAADGYPNTNPAAVPVAVPVAIPVVAPAVPPVQPVSPVAPTASTPTPPEPPMPQGGSGTQGQYAAPSADTVAQAPAYTVPTGQQQATGGKKKTWIIFLVIAAVLILLIGVLAFAVVGFLNFQADNLRSSGGTASISNSSGSSSGGAGTTDSGGSASGTDMPSGYSSIASDDKMDFALGKAGNSAGGGIEVEIYVNNKTSSNVFFLFNDNKINGAAVNDSNVYSSVYYDVKAGNSRAGVVYLDDVKTVDDLKTWSGTIVVVDVDSYDTIANYPFSLTYKK
ncbi:MAG: hypothetical protein FWF71_06600 [Actinomycetia bacterium]|nr:hypothetical protein [Actinomycetes bacterium]